MIAMNSIDPETKIEFVLKNASNALQTPENQPRYD